MARAALAVGIAVGIALAACGDVGPEHVVRAMFAAMHRHDREGVARRYVSPELLGRIVECAQVDEENDWLTPAKRRERVAEYLDDAMEEGWRAKLMSFEEEDRDDPREWRSYAAGEEIWGGCRARVAFRVEKYRIVVRDDSFDRQASLPIDLWVVDGRRYVWSNPLD